jgi:hypothetical protein
MFFMVIVNDTRGPATMLICVTCILLLFFETSFGICLGCLIYNAFSKNKAQLCPGEVCEIKEKHAIQKINAAQLGVLLLVGVTLWAAMRALPSSAVGLPSASPQSESHSQTPAEAERCKVPVFAKAMGHEDMWKQHNNCQ